MAYTKVATISTDTHHSSQEFRASTGAQWPFLSDPERTVQKDLEIQEYTDPEHDPMIPHTLVLKPGLVIHSIYNGYWFWGRPSFVDLWHDLRTVTSEIRPDWDLSKPGLREAWDAGDYSPFHGWNRRSPQEVHRLTVLSVAVGLVPSPRDSAEMSSEALAAADSAKSVGTLVSVNVGMPKNVPWHGKNVYHRRLQGSRQRVTAESAS